MHVVAFKDEVLAKKPWLSQSIMAAFDKAKEACVAYYDDPTGRVLFGVGIFLKKNEKLSATTPGPWREKEPSQSGAFHQLLS